MEFVSSFSLLEFNAVSIGFFLSLRPFAHKTPGLNTSLWMKQFLNLLHHHRWNSFCQSGLKFLKLNHHQNLSDMRALLPALEASEFFEYCLDEPHFGLHDLQ